MNVSDKPWGGFTAADYTAQQWKDACLVHLEPSKGQDPLTKALHKVPVREPDGTLSRGGVHAAAGGHGIGAVQGISDVQRRAAAKQLVDLYENTLKEEPPASLEALAGISETADAREDAREPATAGRSAYFSRSFPLEGIEILSRAKGGDGRTVEAYAAVFNAPQEIQDQHGHYVERVHQTAFNRTLKNAAPKAALCLYNHGMSVTDGRPMAEYGIPLGSPQDIRADGRGLMTVTRYNKSSLADSVLEAIRNDDITAQSFRGRIYRSDPPRVPRAKPGQPLPTITRMELGLSDYGPTPRPAYPGAAIVAVRTAVELYSEINGLDEIERAELIRLLATTRGRDPEPDTATPYRGPGTEDSRDAHSGRSRLLRLRAEAVLSGVLSGTQAVGSHR